MVCLRTHFLLIIQRNDIWFRLDRSYLYLEYQHFYTKCCESKVIFTSSLFTIVRWYDTKQNNKYSNYLFILFSIRVKTN